ncbi:YceI family protein [Planctomicrobium sp. SH668]|uniref:YceI family protein n=1 Tax=Planctomicrobium sp. SH668 TaxID=3448126 RepID=UPI003F5B52B1
MRRFSVVALFTFAVLQLAQISQAADRYTIDANHADVSFTVTHLGLTRIPGRFNEFSGAFTIDEQNPANSKFTMKIKVDSVDTNQKQRDEHLRTADFFDAAKFPEITFESTSVKVVKEGLEVTGDFTMHGVTQPLTLVLFGGNKAEFPEGVHRTGYTTTAVIKRSDFGMNQYLAVVSDAVTISISFEGTKDK